MTRVGHPSPILIPGLFRLGTTAPETEPSFAKKGTVENDRIVGIGFRILPNRSAAYYRTKFPASSHGLAQRGEQG
jgi:hypothetical protein